MRTMVGLAVAGALGTLARYGLEGLVSRRTSTSFPWGTLVVNVAGAFLLGFFTVVTERFRVSSWLRSSMAIGFLGAFTTFSTFAFETFRLIQNGAYLVAGANIFGNVAAGLGALFLGVILGRLI